jgi:hypothetical protein
MRPGLAVALAAFAFAGIGGAQIGHAQSASAQTSTSEQTPSPQVQPLSVFTLSGGGIGFGGFSGLEIDASGTAFIAVNDNGALFSGQITRHAPGQITRHAPGQITRHAPGQITRHAPGQITRHAPGQITRDAPGQITRDAPDQGIKGVTFTTKTRLRNADGILPDEKKLRDFEAIARADDGTLYISVEQSDLLYSFAPGQSTPNASALPVKHGGSRPNNGYEALAIAPDGALFILPESSENLVRPFGLYRLQAGGAWNRIFEMPRAGGYRPVGADFGDDGHLYVLLRAFSGFSFSSKIERIRFDQGVPTHHELLFASEYGQFDNLEGLATWTDASGNLRLLAISDNNFKRFQSNQIVEFILQR